ncbi:MAG: Transcriptional regulator, AsnC family, partial [uncultured Frankineae bacterium]
DHRDRHDQCCRGPDPGGGAAHRRPRGGERGLLGGRGGRPRRPRPRPTARAAARRHRRSAQQGRRRPRHRDPDRLPGLQQARPRGHLLVGHGAV